VAPVHQPSYQFERFQAGTAAEATGKVPFESALSRNCDLACFQVDKSGFRAVCTSNRLTASNSVTISAKSASLFGGSISAPLFLLSQQLPGDAHR